MQRACLRLVRRDLSSKEIAVHLGISPHTVDQHIKEALRRLEITGRHRGAELVTYWESHPHDWGDQQARLAEPSPSGNLAPSTAIAEAPELQVVREDRTEFIASDTTPTGLPQLTGLWLRGMKNDLVGSNTVRGILKLALVISLITLALVAVANTIQVSLEIYFHKH
jgi:hypothetical protein